MICTGAGAFCPEESKQGAHGPEWAVEKKKLKEIARFWIRAKTLDESSS
jgi:hypothetical protein